MPQGSMSSANICGRFRCSKKVEKHCCTDKESGVDICISARFKVNCEVMPLCSFANF